MSYRRPETIMKPESEANKSEAATPVSSGVWLDGEFEI
jgi:hypothetical protein